MNNLDRLHQQRLSEEDRGQQNVPSQTRGSLESRTVRKVDNLNIFSRFVEIVKRVLESIHHFFYHDSSIPGGAVNPLFYDKDEQRPRYSRLDKERLRAEGRHPKMNRMLSEERTTSRVSSGMIPRSQRIEQAEELEQPIVQMPTTDQYKARLERAMKASGKSRNIFSLLDPLDKKNVKVGSFPFSHQFAKDIWRVASMSVNGKDISDAYKLPSKESGSENVYANAVYEGMRDGSSAASCPPLGEKGAERIMHLADQAFMTQISNNAFIFLSRIGAIFTPEQGYYYTLNYHPEDNQVEFLQECAFTLRPMLNPEQTDGRMVLKRSVLLPLEVLTLNSDEEFEAGARKHMVVTDSYKFLPKS